MQKKVAHLQTTSKEKAKLEINLVVVKACL